MASNGEREADRELKAKHRALWASGNYAAVAAELVQALGPELVRASGVRAGQRVLDVGAGTGNAAIPAAAEGAMVTASDLTPEPFDTGRRSGRARRRPGVAGGRRGGASLRGRRVRRGDVLPRGDVRAAPPDHRR